VDCGVVLVNVPRSLDVEKPQVILKVLSQQEIRSGRGKMRAVDRRDLLIRQRVLVGEGVRLSARLKDLLDLLTVSRVGDEPLGLRRNEQPLVVVGRGGEVVDHRPQVVERQ